MRASSPQRASKRLVAALFASAIVHLLLTSTVKPGSARGDLTGVSRASSSVRIAARLGPHEPEQAIETVAPVPEPSLKEAPVQKPDNVARVVKRAASAEATVASGPAEIPDPTYYSARQLDVYPTIVGAFEPGYPDAADANGYVLLLVLIDTTGVVDEVSVVEAHPRGEFEDAARHALRSARFTPAMRHGRAVRSRVLIHVNYGPEETR